MSVFDFFRRMGEKMFGLETIRTNIGACALSESMVSSIGLWDDMLCGRGPWRNELVTTINCENGIVTELANICLSEISVSVSNEDIDAYMQDCINRLNGILGNGLALGSFVIKPLGEGSNVEFVSADKFIPIAFDINGRMIKVVFIDVRRVAENDYYIRLERHSLNKDKSLVISNMAYRSSDGAKLGRFVELWDCPIQDWQTLEPWVMYENVEKPIFAYFKTPITNTVDGSPCGISIYNNAIELIKKAETQFARLDWEYESGERAIHVDTTALNAKGVLPKLNKRLYRGLNIDDRGGELFKEFSPGMRDDAYIRGLNEYLRRIEFSVGLAYGDLSNVNLVEKTAEEIKTSKQRKYQLINAIEKELKKALLDLVYAFCFYEGILKRKVETNISFSDSILSDEGQDLDRMRNDVAAGFVPAGIYLERKYNLSSDEAKEWLDATNGDDTNADT